MPTKAHTAINTTKRTEAVLLLIFSSLPAILSASESNYIIVYIDYFVKHAGYIILRERFSSCALRASERQVTSLHNPFQKLNFGALRINAKRKALLKGLCTNFFYNRTHNQAEMFTADIRGPVMPLRIRVVDWDFLSYFMRGRGLAD